MNKQALSAGRRVLPLYQAIDVSTKAAADKENATCLRGCAHCCYSLVACSVLEAIPIAEYMLKSALWAPRLTKVKAKLEEEAALVDQLGGLRGPAGSTDTSLSYMARKIPCTFLKKNKDCAIYSLRPVACRLYYVVSDPEQCSLDHPGHLVRYIHFDHVASQFWIKSLSNERDYVPPIIDCFQRVLLIALELLQRDRASFERWLEEHKKSIRAPGLTL